MTDYSKFPFQDLTTKEIAQLMMESFRFRDDEFAVACREQLKKRKDFTTFNKQEKEHEGTTG